MKILINLSYNDVDLSDLEGRDQIEAALKEAGVHYRFVRILDTELLVFNGMVVDDMDYPDPVSFEDWIYGSGARSVLTDVTAELEEKFVADFWRYPPVLYHATKRDRVKDIQEHGLIPSSETRGINNRNVGKAVFTSTDASFLDSYGPVLITIDTHAMKKDGFHPKVKQEPEIAEKKACEAVAYRLGFRDFYPSEVESGVYEETVIFDRAIPAKYLEIDV